jgi:ABC-type Na+ efflux pump permease subunit
MAGSPRTPGFASSAWTVYVKEMRSLLRDRQTLIYSIVIPLFLYPVLLLATVQVFSYAKGIQEHRAVRVAVPEESRGHEFVELLGRGRGVEIVSAAGAAQGEARDILAAGDVDLLLELEEVRAGEPAARLRLRARYSLARDGSVEARKRLEEAAAEFRDLSLEHAARGLGSDASFLDVIEIAEEDLSTEEEVTSYLAGLLLPLVMIVMIALGALWPALDCTVGEKERRTLETTLLSPVPRSSLVVGKYMAVVTFSLAAFLLNLGSMSLTLSHLDVQLDLHTLRLGPGAILAVLGGAFLLAVFLSGVIMIAAFLARSFKEGQTHTMPVYVVAVVSSFVIASPEISLSPALAWVPLVNLVLLFREALSDRLTAVPATMALLSSVLYTAAALAVAARILGRESVATGGGGRMES